MDRERDKMRIKIKAKSDKTRFLYKPFNEAITAYIYDMIRLADKGFGDDLHNQGYKLGYKSFRFFTYSNIFTEGGIAVSGILPDGYIEFQFSSLIDDIVINFVKGMQKVGYLQIYDVKLPILEISRVKDDYAFKNGGMFKLISPVVMNGKDRCLYPHEMKEKLVNNLIEKYYVYNRKMPEMNLELRFMSSSSRKINYKNTTWTGFKGVIAMQGNPELIQIAYQAGIGAKNGQGCGMLEVLQ